MASLNLILGVGWPGAGGVHGAPHPGPHEAFSAVVAVLFVIWLWRFANRLQRERAAKILLFRPRLDGRASLPTLLAVLLLAPGALGADETAERSDPGSATAEQGPPLDPLQAPSDPEGKPPSKLPTQYGGFGDIAYLRDFNRPVNRLFRSRGTAWHVNELDLNMAGAYVKQKASEASHWGAELLLQTGKDCEVFGFSATAPNIGGYRWLRHVGLANVSYLALAGNGLTLQGGIFPSLIGYDSLYAKDNFNYTRPWGADFTPYLMLGVNASYPFNDKLTGTLFVVNGYWHLANANSVPSSGGQLAYKATGRTTLKQTLLYGPHQSSTSLEFWRFLSDSICEWKADRVTLAVEYQVSSERVDVPGRPRAWWMAAQAPARWNVHGPWSVAIRPEVAWDSEGRWTLYKQTVKAVTTTLEYRLADRQTNTILRLEHRFDDSRGRDGGFFKDGEVRPGVIGLTPGQHLLIFGLMFTFDRS